MANTHTLLSRGRWKGVPLADLVLRELEPYMSDGNVTADGPDVVLSAEATQALAMVLHELVTNAAKYGALSAARGRVSVRWGYRSNGSALGTLTIAWQETGGPVVEAPTRCGFGTSVIRDLVPYELGGAVDLTYVPDGIRCTIELPRP